MNIADFVPQYSKMLKNLDTWLEKAIAFAAAKKFDVDTLVHARLAADMYSLDRQVQSACPRLFLDSGIIYEQPDQQVRRAGSLFRWAVFLRLPPAVVALRYQS